MTCTEPDYASLADALAGAWQRFECFGWWEKPEGVIERPDDWALVYTSNRDSGLLDQSNAAAIAKALSRFPKTAIPQTHNHWACGYVEGFALCVRDERGRISKAFKTWCDLQSKIA